MQNDVSETAEMKLLRKERILQGRKDAARRHYITLSSLLPDIQFCPNGSMVSVRWFPSQRSVLETRILIVVPLSSLTSILLNPSVTLRSYSWILITREGGAYNYVVIIQRRILF